MQASGPPGTAELHAQVTQAQKNVTLLNNQYRAEKKANEQTTGQLVILQKAHGELKSTSNAQASAGMFVVRV